MFAASTYEEIERIESQVENMEIVVFLFARPTEEKILKEFEYIHYNSAKYCSIYAIGYTDDFAKAEDQTYRKVDAMMQRTGISVQRPLLNSRKNCKTVFGGTIPVKRKYSSCRTILGKRMF